jgi:hypothetical protein
MMDVVDDMRRARTVRMILPVLAAIGQLLGCTGVTGIIPGVMPHDLRYDAATLEHDRCDPTPVDPHIYGSDIIVKVEPYYHLVMGGPNGQESILAGAQLELRPSPGLTVEMLERGLTCRAAQVMLGHAEPAPGEPYALTDSWVKIDVKSGHGSFLVNLSAEDPKRAREVLDRARAFAASNPATVGTR